LLPGLFSLENIVNFETTKLSISRPQAGLAPLEIDLTLARKAEASLREIAAANSSSSLSLASTFSVAYDSLARAYGALYAEASLATIASRKRRSVVLLDLAAGIAQAKGLASSRSPTGSEDVREAICYADDEFTAIETYRAGIEAAKELVYMKMQAIRMGFDAVRAILKANDGAPGSRVSDLSAPSESVLLESAEQMIEQSEKLPPALTITTEASKSTPTSVFGRPSYSR
jgi:hypothetical protein